MSISIELPEQELSALRQMTKLDDNGAAVVRAAREYLRLIRLRELKAASGNVEFELDWQKQEALELSNVHIPQ